MGKTKDLLVKLQSLILLGEQNFWHWTSTKTSNISTVRGYKRSSFHSLASLTLRPFLIAKLISNFVRGGGGGLFSTLTKPLGST